MKWPIHKVFRTFFALPLISVFLFFQANARQSFTGKVVGVSDGGTIKVMRQGRAVKVGLAGINCPERKQPYGTKAKRFTSDRAFRNRVTVHI